MGRNKRGRAGQKPKDSASPTSSAEGGNIQHQPNPKPGANDCRYVKQEPPNIYVNIPDGGEEKWSYANKIAAAIGAITLALTVFTYLLFVKAGVQADQAVRAANSADSVFVETKKEFTVLNEPYLQFDFKGLDTPKVGRHLTEFVDIKNLGKYPVQIVEAKFSSAIKVNVPDFGSVYKQMGVIENTHDEYVTETHPLLNIYSSDIFPLTESEFKELNDPKYFYYFIGYCKYQNLITKVYKTYEVIIQYNYVSKHFWYKRNINYVDSSGINPSNNKPE